MFKLSYSSITTELYKRPTAQALIGAMLFSNMAPLIAADNPYSNTTITNEHKGQMTEDLTLTVGVDWDYDATSPVVQQLNGKSHLATDNSTINPDLNRAALRTMLNNVAATLYTATEGRHRIDKFYVYRNAVTTNYDITISNQDAASDIINIAGWGKHNKSAWIMLSHSGTAMDLVSMNSGTTSMGLSIARGLVSYMYGLAPESKGPYTCGQGPIIPCSLDIPVNSLLNPDAMKNNAPVNWLSKSSDYSSSGSTYNASGQLVDNVGGVTAQLRVYGFSDWDVLTQPTSSDPARAASLGRTAFAALLDSPPVPPTIPSGQPNEGLLGGHTLSADSKAEPTITFIPSPLRKDVILIDRTGTNAQLNERKAAAMSILQHGGKAQFAIASSPAYQINLDNLDAYSLIKRNPANKLIGSYAKVEMNFSENATTPGVTPYSATYIPNNADLGFIYNNKIQAISSTDVNAKDANNNSQYAAAGAYPLDSITANADFSNFFVVDNALQWLTYQLIKGVKTVDFKAQSFNELNEGDFSTIHIITGSDPGISPATIQILKDSKINLDTVIIKAPGSTPASARSFIQSVPSRSISGVATPPAIPTGLLSLSKAADLTGGVSNVAKNGTDAAKDLNKAANALQGTGIAPITSDESDIIVPGKPFTSTFMLASGAVDKDVTIELAMMESDFPLLTPSITGPGNKSATFPIGPNSDPTQTVTGTINGFSYSYNQDEGTYTITIPAALRTTGGNWTLTLTSTAPTTEGVSAVISSVGGLPFVVSSTGGLATDSQPLMIFATVGGRLKVLNATVTATVYDRDGNEVLSNIVLKDDGLGADLQQNDGTYSASLAGLLSEGDYEIEVQALTDGTTSTDMQKNTIEAFTRVDSTESSVEAQTAPTAIQLNLVAGWNLLGNSVHAPLTVATTFPDSNKVATVWKWAPATAQWAFYSPALSDGGQAYAAKNGYLFLSTINEGEGFWVNAGSDFTAALPSGTAIDSTKFTENKLPKGWSLIAVGGNPAPKDFVNNIALVAPTTGKAATSVTTLWTWNNKSRSWYFYAPALDNLGTLTSYSDTNSYLDFTRDSKTLDPTTGFWVNHQ
jgi:hypothetical protein